MDTLSGHDRTNVRPCLRSMKKKRYGAINLHTTAEIPDFSPFFSETPEKDKAFPKHAVPMVTTVGFPSTEIPNSSTSTSGTMGSSRSIGLIDANGVLKSALAPRSMTN